MRTKALLLIIWMIITLVLTLSVVGMLLFVATITHYERGAPDIKRSSWMQMGKRLLDGVLAI